MKKRLCAIGGIIRVTVEQMTDNRQPESGSKIMKLREKCEVLYLIHESPYSMMNDKEVVGQNKYLSILM